MNTRVRAAVLAGTIAVAATSCGGSGSGGAAAGDVVVTMKDYSLDATPGTFGAGRITFGIQNDGPSAHEFVIIRSDDEPATLPVENGLIPEDQVSLVDEAEDIPPGTATSLTVTLDPGSYVLVCNLPSHYTAGMHAAFTVV